MRQLRAIAMASCTIMLASFSAGGCDADDAANRGPCQTTEAYFSEAVWGPILSQDCIGCHSPQGKARDSMFVLRSPAQPGYMEANLAMVRDVAAFEYDGTSILLLRPTAQIDHPGGERFAVGSKEYEVLAELLRRFESPVACADTDGPERFSGVTFAGTLQTLRKAVLNLAGRLPTLDEERRIAEGGEAELDAILMEVMGEEAFMDRVMEIYNDVLLTDRYLGGNDAVNLLSGDDYPDRRWWDNEEYGVDEAVRELGDRHANDSVAREALALIAHVVREDRPFTEVLTADYAVVNSLSARVYGVQELMAFVDPDDPDEFREVQVPGVAHAGVLTSPMFLNRFPTTATNVNRHRSRMVHQFFLATDILKLADRPIDITANVDHNPTLYNPNCVVCHETMDPLAGTFLNWDAQGRYRPPEGGWHEDMRPPGFGDDVLPPARQDAALQWVAEKISADKRFPRAALEIAFRGITGQRPLSAPGDAQAPSYGARLRAFEAQEAVFAKIVEAFLQTDSNFKVLVLGIIRSEYFRAENASNSVDALVEEEPERTLELASLGMGRLLTPEQLHRKIQAVTGYPWRSRGWATPDLLGDFRIFYGGIDSDDVVSRIVEPNGIMANVAWRMANEVACQVTARDFSENRAARRLFPEVEASFTPEDANGFEIAGGAQAIRDNLVYLHQRILGETLVAGDVELERTWTLFLETWREGKALVDSEELSRDLDWACQARTDYWTGEDLHPDKQVRRDQNYTIRAWAAVLTYLLSDYRFIYE